MPAPVNINDVLTTCETPFNKQNSFGLKFETECLFAKQQLLKNDYTLAAARNAPNSLRAAILNVAAIGISLNPASAHAYLVPRSPAKGKPTEICLDISYRGLVKLATDSGAIEWAKAVLVYEGDEFKWRGPAEAPHHEADVFAKDRIDASDPLKNLKGGYCLAKLTGGEYMVEVMTADEIMEVKNSSKAANGPWKGAWAGEMAKKTLVKRAYKSWPQSGGRERLDSAVSVLNQHEGLEETIPVDEQQIAEYKRLVAAKDCIGLAKFQLDVGPEVSTRCFNSGLPDEKVDLKNRVRALEAEANQRLDAHVDYILELCEADDPAAAHFFDGELNGAERELVGHRLKEIEHYKLQQLRESVA